jgi:hypothetical protein
MSKPTMTDLRMRLVDALRNAGVCEVEPSRGNTMGCTAEHAADVLPSMPGIQITETLPGFGYMSGGSDV